MGKKERRKKLAKKTVIQYKKAKKGKKKCAVCSKRLQGTATSEKERKLSKTQKRPSRIFGGVLCANCTVKMIEEAVKVKVGVKSLEKIDLSVKKYVEGVISRIK